MKDKSPKKRGRPKNDIKKSDFDVQKWTLKIMESIKEFEAGETVFIGGESLRTLLKMLTYMERQETRIEELEKTVAEQTKQYHKAKGFELSQGWPTLRSALGGNPAQNTEKRIE